MDNNKLELDVLAHRYLYYVLMSPVISDIEYDRLEQKACEKLDDESPVHGIGSSLEEDYSSEVIRHALKLKSEKNNG